MLHSIPVSPDLKVCTKCGQAKPLTEYTQRKSGARAGRYEERCKACSRASSKAYRTANPERVRELARAARAPHEHKYLARDRELRATDPEYRKKRNDHTRVWRERNREHIAEYNAAQPLDYKRAAVRASNAAHPEHVDAREAVASQVRSGKMPAARTLLCAHCGAPANQYHHHNGYAPEHKLDVIALCTTCHGKAHWVD